MVAREKGLGAFQLSRMPGDDRHRNDHDSFDAGVDEIAGHDAIEVRARKAALTTPDGFVAFGFGSGLLTRAPGTVGTLAAIPIAVLVSLLGFNLFWFAFFGFCLGVWVCSSVTRALEIEDYGGIVWDEMVGFWLVVAFVPQHWAWYTAAFVLFRFFDILKPWPISEVDRAVSGGLGIMLDDVLAAVYTILLLSFVRVMILGS